MAINKATLAKTHSDYDANSGLWDFFWQSYEGGAEYITGGNLIQHSPCCEIRRCRAGRAETLQFPSGRYLNTPTARVIRLNG